MEQADTVLRCGRRSLAVPGIQTNVVVVAAGGNEHGLGAVAGGDFKAEEAAIEVDGAVEICYFEVDVTDPGLGGYDIVVWFHGRFDAVCKQSIYMDLR